MKIALFDDINETHVCDALERALRALGHEVLATGRIWRGHGPPGRDIDLARIDRHVDALIDAGCQALFNFRASTLTPMALSRLRRAGVATAVWLPDDPVLYAVAYRDAVDHYDHVLHCGGARVLAFYEGQGHRPGFNFPFWLDPERWPHAWDPARAPGGLVFVGNLHGPAKRGRYASLALAAPGITVYGNCPEDPSGIHAGELYGIEALQAVIARHQAGLDMPQVFARYRGSAYDFGPLAGLGAFDVPSRVPQYAAVGLPVVSLGGEASPSGFQAASTVADMRGALAVVARLRQDPAGALQTSREARAEVVAHFSGLSRARMLEAVFAGRLAPHGMSAQERATAYRLFPE